MTTSSAASVGTIIQAASRKSLFSRRALTSGGVLGGGGGAEAAGEISVVVANAVQSERWVRGLGWCRPAGRHHRGLRGSVPAGRRRDRGLHVLQRLVDAL